MSESDAEILGCAMRYFFVLLRSVLLRSRRGRGTGGRGSCSYIGRHLHRNSFWGRLGESAGIPSDSTLLLGFLCNRRRCHRGLCKSAGIPSDSTLLLGFLCNRRCCLSGLGKGSGIPPNPALLLLRWLGYRPTPSTSGDFLCDKGIPGCDSSIVEASVEPKGHHSAAPRRWRCLRGR